MINLTHYGATAERVCLTLTEAASCGYTGAWGFLLTSAVTGATVVFTAPDVSASPGRYNEFLWQSVGPTGQDLGNGMVYLPDSGTYDYVAYEATVAYPLVMSGAGVTAVNGTYDYTLPQGAGAYWTNSAGYYITYIPNYGWAVWSPDAFPLVQYSTSDVGGATSALYAGIVWNGHVNFGAAPAPSSTVTPVFTLGPVVEVGRLTLHPNPVVELPDYTTGDVTVIPTFE